MPHKIFPLSENAVTIDFGNEISLESNQKVIQLGKRFSENPFSGFIECVSAYSSLTIFFNLLIVRENCQPQQTAFDCVCGIIESYLNNLTANEIAPTEIIKIPVSYREKDAIDLDFVAEFANLSKKEVVRLHTSKIYRVFMIGFLPAFPYMGEVDAQVATPRKHVPSRRINKGSVGIAGLQTGIYPMDSPGGWQIIGKTALELFKPESQNISLLKAGDMVQFFDVDSI